MSSIIALTEDPRTASDPLAARSFKVFEKLTVSNLAGLFDSELWQGVLRASQHNTALWHAATAVGSAHEAYLHRKFDMDTINEDRALKQYNKAIRSLTRPNSGGEQATPNVIIAASILFMAFEVRILNHLAEKF
jgi:hypothetical protein